MSDDNIGVCLWTAVPPPYLGMGIWAVRYSEAAPRFGLSVDVVDVSPPPGSFSERSVFRMDRVGVALRAWRDLWRLLRRQRPDVCHINSPLGWGAARDAGALIICRWFGVPTVLHLHVSTQVLEWRDGMPPIGRWLVDRFLRSAKLVLVLSRELETYLAAALPGLCIIRIGNMVSPHEDRVGGDPVLPERSGRTRVLFVGSITPNKGVIELAHAIGALPDCELVMVGERGGVADPAKGGELRRAFEVLRAEGRLIEMGALADPGMVATAYEESDLFVLPSHREGMPGAILEALAAGTATVATGVGGIPDILEDECGELVPVGDTAALTQKLAMLAGSPERRAELAKNGRRRVAERFYVDVVMGRYVDGYRSIIPVAADEPAISLRGNL